MKLYSTNNKSKLTSLKDAVLKGLPDDNGLYMPQNIPLLSSNFIKSLSDLSFQDISFYVANALIGDSVPKHELENIISNSISFPAPLVNIDSNINILELFHGPSLAFKDFGARFMAQLMGYFNRNEEEKLTILVATSGDTGGAVASGFFNIPGINVVILYPSGKVSKLQELQLTTFGGNISALEVDGTFDDCQTLVKSAFLDFELNSSFRLSSANSINIARLIPQCFYYFEGFKQAKYAFPVIFSIPSGNFGNLTAGLFAKHMGLPIFKLIAATNANDIFPQYLSSGRFNPKPSIQTISNAMDVGNPSNFSRVLDIYSSTWNNIKDNIIGYSISDNETKNCISRVFKENNYVLDPHSAVAYTALEKYQKTSPLTFTGIVLETAHPSKFKDTIESVLDIKIEIPSRLSILHSKEQSNFKMKNNLDSFKSYLFEKIK